MKDTLRETLQAVMPLAALVLVFQAAVLSMPAAVIVRFLVGTVMVTAGLFLFLQGVRTSLLPIGRAIGAEMPKRVSFGVLLVLAFALGFAATVAEPDVRVLAYQVDIVSGGEIGRGILILSVALGVGVSVSLAMLRIFLGVPIAWILGVGYVAVLVLSFFVPAHFVPVAFDAGGVTTGPVTVPFILSLGIGVVSVLGGKSALADGFGIVGLASIGPVVGVMLLGIFYG
ncbi:MAG: DUF1538 domain-containing protein [Candidatus Aminicenantes bacterium]|nr:DUF1538 domain-containing protein [Candidatus Aminicenantes bacterium]